MTSSDARSRNAGWQAMARPHVHGTAPRRTSGGFSLLELIVVVMIIGIMTAGVTPMFRTSLASIRGDRTARDLAATFRYASEMSVIEGVEYRVYITTDEGRYWIERKERRDDGTFVFSRISGLDGRTQSFPTGMTVDRIRAQRDRERERELGRDLRYVGFYPGGACDFADIRVERTDGKNVSIKLEGTVSRIKTETSR